MYLFASAASVLRIESTLSVERENKRARTTTHNAGLLSMRLFLMCLDLLVCQFRCVPKDRDASCPKPDPSELRP
jgi:hypothetical protein